jgi:periplasmic protein TonB
MKRIIKLSSFFCLAIIVLIACTSKTPQPQKTMTVPVKNTENSPLINPNDSTEEPDIYEEESMPVFPGGEEKLLEFITKNIRYPAIAEKKGIQGTVIVGFAVTSTGKIENVHVIRSLYPACDREAIRVVKLMPCWIPGRQNGEDEAVNYTLPIIFKLE